MHTRNLKILALLIVGIVLIMPAKACEIKFKVSSGEKKIYTVGDEVIVTVNVIYTHRVCPEGIIKTKFKFTGIKALGATPWKTISDGKYERKLKLKILEEGKNKHIINAVRSCDKDGGAGSISLKVE